uniref:Uncharacterized protein n=1 Tax=Rhizophora mucronata TaxID=61149 RepID=A0A2P2QC81_RHIMU
MCFDLTNKKFVTVTCLILSLIMEFIISSVPKFCLIMSMLQCVGGCFCYCY